MSRLTEALFLIATAALPALPQTVSGTITGVVVDARSAPIPGATVTLRNEATGQQTIQETNETGVFVFSAVLAGRYAFVEEGVVAPPAEAPWVAPWSPGASTAEDVRRRLR